MSKICSVDDCNRNARCMGFCNKHYRYMCWNGIIQQRPNMYSTDEEFAKYFISICEKKDDCLLWTKSLVGTRPRCNLKKGDGYVYSPQRLVYEYETGIKLKTDQPIWALCGNNHCLNVKHLTIMMEYKESGDKQKDLHTLLTKTSKLTLQERMEIESSDMTVRQLAEIYGVSHQRIHQIKGVNHV